MGSFLSLRQCHGVDLWITVGLALGKRDGYGNEGLDRRDSATTGNRKYCSDDSEPPPGNPLPDVVVQPGEIFLNPIDTGPSKSCSRDGFKIKFGEFDELGRFADWRKFVGHDEK